MACGQQDLHALLSEIFHYLSENLSDEMLSHTAENERKALLEKLSCIFPEMPSTYLDMNGKRPCDGEYVSSDVSKIVKDKRDSPDISSEKYSNISDNSLEITHKNSHPENNFMQMNISYKDVCIKAVKCGPLLRRERLFFLDQYRRFWAGLLDQTFLLYASERDTKPVFTLNIQGFSAHRSSVVTKDTKKKNMGFEIVCPGQKTYHFIARTTKDMDQWVAAITEASGHDPSANQKNVNQPVRKLPSLPNDAVQEEYDDIDTFKNSEEEIYHDISDMRPNILEGGNTPVMKISSPGYISEKQGNEFGLAEENEDEIYDDVKSFSTDKGVEFLEGLNRPQQLKTFAESLASRREEIESSRKICEEAEEIYDDIGPKNTGHKQINSGMRKLDFGPIEKTLRDQIIASVFKIQKPCPPQVKMTRPTEGESSEELYESIENPNS